MKPYRVSRRGQKYWALEIGADLLGPGAPRSVVMAATREEVKKRWEARVALLKRGVDVALTRATVAEFIDEFLERCRNSSEMEPSTIEGYRYNIDCHIKPLIGKLRLNELDVRQIDRFVAEMRRKVSPRTGKPLAPKTIHLSYATLRSALQLAVDYSLLEKNPAAAGSRRCRLRLKSGSSGRPCFTPDEAWRFIEAVRGHRYEALYVLAITCGMRKGELLGAQWPDIDLENARLTVNHALSSTRRLKGTVGPRWVLKDPKTRLSRRTIDLPKVAVEALRRHRAIEEEVRAAAGAAYQPHDFVFRSLKGTPIDTGNATRDFNQICERAELPHIRFHDLRHTHASLLINVGVHAKKIAERLGHSTIRLTLDNYGHLFSGIDKESAERMDDLFGPPPEPKPAEAQKSAAVAPEPDEQAEPEEIEVQTRAKVIVMPRRRAG